ncbi:Tll0287-like domain-containing protein [Sulfurimonas sp.]
MKILKSIALMSIATALLLAAPQGKKDAEFKGIIQMGKKSSKLLLKTLGTNMKKNMKDGGVMKALDFCSQEAYTLTEQVNKKLPKGVRVKRISSQYRNPANKPEGNEAKVLEALKTLQDANVILPRQIVEKIDTHTYKYYKPLVIKKKVCLKCHGNIQDVELRRAIEERYPIDKATHYKMGDLRGAVVVTIKK